MITWWHLSNLVQQWELHPRSFSLLGFETPKDVRMDWHAIQCRS